MNKKAAISSLLTIISMLAATYFICYWIVLNVYFWWSGVGKSGVNFLLCCITTLAPFLCCLWYVIYLDKSGDV